MQFIFKHVSIYTTLGKIPWIVFFSSNGFRYYKKLCCYNCYY